MPDSLLFWLIAAALTALVVRVVVAPLGRARKLHGRAESDIAVYRDQLAEIDRDLERGLIQQKDAEAARAEVSRRLLAADAARSGEGSGEGEKPVPPRLIYTLALLIPLVAIPLYLIEGAPGLPSSPFAERLGRPLEEQSLEELVARVEQHLRENPADAEGWKVIAPVYGRLGRFDDASRAFSRAIALDGPTANLLADYGEALVFAEEGVVRADARAAFEDALEIDPTQPQARFYIGLAFEQEGETDRAREIWQALADEAPPDAPWRRLIEQRLAALDGAVPPGAAVPPGGEGIAAMPPAERAAAIEAMVEGLAARLEEEGGTPDEWARLIRARKVLGDDEAAQLAFSKASEAFAGNDEAIALFEAAMNPQ